MKTWTTAAAVTIFFMMVFGNLSKGSSSNNCGYHIPRRKSWHVVQWNNNNSNNVDNSRSSSNNNNNNSSNNSSSNNGYSRANNNNKRFSNNNNNSISDNNAYRSSSSNNNSSTGYRSSNKSYSNSSNNNIESIFEFTLTSGQGPSLCLHPIKNPNKDLTLKLAFTGSEIDFPIESYYTFANPKVSLDCQCTCERLCQRQNHCKSCFHIRRQLDGLHCIKGRGLLCCKANVALTDTARYRYLSLKKKPERIFSFKMETASISTSFVVSEGSYAHFVIEDETEVFIMASRAVEKSLVDLKEEVLVDLESGKAFGIAQNLVNGPMEWDPR